MNIIIPGTPLAQQRMRFSGRNGIGRLYDPCAKEKKAIREVIVEQFGDHHMFIHPRISFIFLMPIPKCITKKQLAIHQTGFLKHEKKPDADNIAKLILDCMDGIVFDGDQHVSIGCALKLYHPQPQTIALVREETQSLRRHEVTPEVYTYLCGT